MIRWIAGALRLFWGPDRAALAPALAGRGRNGGA